MAPVWPLTDPDRYIVAPPTAEHFELVSQVVD